MPRELTGPDPYDRPADRDAPTVAVVVEELRLSRFLIIHRRWCPCAWEPHTAARARHPLQVRDLRHLLEVVWPHHAVPGFATRDLAGRCALAACRPPLPIHPWHRTLMKEHNTMNAMPVLVCPDATGKFVVHDPACGHGARMRAAKDGSGQRHTVASLPDLVRAMHAPETLAGEGALEQIMESEYEVRDCTPLPVENPAEEKTPQEAHQDTMGWAVLRAYNALTSLYATAVAVDSQRARDAAQRLEQRLATTAPRRRPAGNLTPYDIHQHWAASTECGAWVAVKAGAEEQLAQQASDMDRAKLWVATARAMVKRFETQWRHGGDEGGTAIQRAKREAEEEGRRQFVVRVTDALHEVAELMEKRGNW